MSGAPVGGLTPVGGTTNIGILKEGNIRVSSFALYSNGDEYYNGDSGAEQGIPLNYNSTFIGLLAGYGINEDFTIDIEFGYYLDKSQDFGLYKLSGFGFSHATLYGKYNLINSRAKEFEWTIGIGGRLPLSFSEQNLPQNIQSSTGAYGLIGISYLHQGFRSQNIHFILVNKIDYNSSNNSFYRYGNSYLNSIFIIKNIMDMLTGIFEIRSNIRQMDAQNDLLNDNSGWNLLIVSPQINYSLSNFNFSLFYDYPIYKYYNGTQLTNSNSFGLSLTWQSNLLKYID